MAAKKPTGLKRYTPLKRSTKPIKRSPIKPSSKVIARSPVKPGRGLKGDPVSAEQKAFHDALCQHVGCIACRVEFGITNTYVSVHHMRGRKAAMHWLALPLCAGHHQKGTGNVLLIAVHPDKARFEKAFGTQAELLAMCKIIVREAGFTGPVEASNEVLG